MRYVSLVIAASIAMICGCEPAAKAPSSAASKTLPAGKQPHVILISLCSVRADHFGCYGYARATTPHIDEFAKQSVLMENAVTPWPKTAPSFSAVMTGLYPHQTGILRTTPNQRVRDDIVTLAERFKSAGYHTGAFVSSPALNVNLNLTQGFDVYQECFRAVQRWRTTVDHGLAWLKSTHKNPSLLWVHFNNAHYPYRPNEKFQDLFVDDSHYDASKKLAVHMQDMPIVLPPDHPAKEPVRRPDLGGVHKLAILHERPTERDFYIARYDAGIRSADEYIGEVLKGVRDSLGDEPYVIALWADHGESLGEHNYYFEHGRFAYESCSHVPLIIFDSHRDGQGVRVSQPVSTVDMAPTICALAGVAGDGLAGVDLADVIVGKAQRGDVFFNGGYQPDFITGIRRGSMKLLDIPNPIDQQMMRNQPMELYDIATDAMETHDLTRERPDEVRTLSAALAAWRSPWWKQAVGQTALTPTKYDPKLRGQLKTLGYLSGDDDDAPASQPATMPAQHELSNESKNQR